MFWGFFPSLFDGFYSVTIDNVGFFPSLVKDQHALSGSINSYMALVMSVSFCNNQCSDYKPGFKRASSFPSATCRGFTDSFLFNFVKCLPCSNNMP